MVISAMSYTGHYGVLTDSKTAWSNIERINFRTQFNADNMKGEPKITLETYREIEAVKPRSMHIGIMVPFCSNKTQNQGQNTASQDVLSKAYI